MKRIVIAHMYPREMNIYGDMGNILTLRRRLEWRGFETEVRAVEIGQEFDFSSVDILFGGGGQDRGQLLVGDDLMTKAADIRVALTAGLPTLVVCGLYQLFGHSFKTVQGREIPGIDVFNATTIGGSKRMIGNIVIDSPLGRLVGFENHSGQTVLDPGQAWLGKVRRGYGNNPRRQTEGAWTANAIGTYLHGPVLPKNPSLADHIILKALKRRGMADSLEPLDDQIELEAAKVAMSRPQ